MLVPSTPSNPPAAGRTLVIGGLAASLVAVTVAAAAFGAQAHPTEIVAAAAPADPCAIAADVSTLGLHEQALAARRAMACADLEHRRISLSEYRATLAQIDRAWLATPPAPPQIQWASNVRDLSTQYTTTSWSAGRVLGAPDVSTAGSDHVNAWASLGADDRDEWLEVGFQQPVRANAVDVVETYNPGAVSSIVMITQSGRRITAYAGAVGAVGTPSRTLRAATACTDEPIVAVRVEIASRAVPGWNEIDAIGIEPCAAQ